MIKRVIGTLVSLAVLATVVVTVLHRDRFRSMLPERSAVEIAAGDSLSRPGAAAPDSVDLLPAPGGEQRPEGRVSPMSDADSVAADSVAASRVAVSAADSTADRSASPEELLRRDSLDRAGVETSR